MPNQELKVGFARALRDNYVWLIHAPREPSRVLVVDPGEARPVLEALDAAELEPAGILITHHHPDHTGGVPELRKRFAIPVFGPAREARGVVTEPLGDGDSLRVPELGVEFRVLEIPGHTAGHIAFHGHAAVFCGDTLFSAGCGRLFEGTPRQMVDSLARLAALPGETAVYCGHEYTEANLRFGLAVEPDNAAMREHLEWCRRHVGAATPSLPSRIEREKAINVFLRCERPEVRRAAAVWSGAPADDTVTAFAALRRWKDGFRG